MQQEIEETFRNLKHLPRQKLHPFDLRPEELLQIKEYFPEFKVKKDKTTTRGSTKNKGIQITELKEILSKKINISEETMDRLISKLDHKNEDKINWTEFLNFLSHEGSRRETVNDA